MWREEPMEQLKGRAVLLRNFQVQKTFYGWNSGKCLAIAKAAVEVMLSGKDTEDIQAGIAIIILLCCISFF